MYVCGITFLLFQYTIASSSADDKLDQQQMQTGEVAILCERWKWA